jgi:hypothetical protein
MITLEKVIRLEVNIDMLNNARNGYLDLGLSIPKDLDERISANRSELKSELESSQLKAVYSDITQSKKSHVCVL